jgi:two-component system chemotaxis sensor kinase CheA
MLSKTFDYGKYKGIIISVALFLLLDASVLMMNFYISFEIADDAEGVNIAGRQRMLSQRMMKSLLDYQSSGDIDVQQSSLKELSSTIALFDQTLTAFEIGGETKSAKGEPIFIEAATSPESMRAVQEARSIWNPLNRQLNRLIRAHNNGDLDQLNTQLVLASEYGRKQNLKLLKLMNTLTVDLEQVAASKANRLRLIQTVGITLAVINFFIIMFHFLRQLRESDIKIESARKETQEILDTVNEGLFLIDKNQKIGSQYSEHLLSILGKDNISGQPFDELLRGMVSEKDRDTAESYIKLLFDPKKKQKLLGDLNPLRQIEVHIPNDDGSYENKHLSFAFSRVVKNREILHVLVTVLDITKQVELSREVETMKNQGQEQLELLSTILQCNPDMLSRFIENSYTTFNQINEILKTQSKHQGQYIEKAQQIFALVHNFKGEAAALELHQFVDAAHEFENQIQDLKSMPTIQGNDFLKLTIQLNRLISQTESTHKLVDKVSGLTTVVSTEHEGNYRYPWEQYQKLATDTADRQGKQVEVLCSGFNDYPLSDGVATQVNTIIVHMIRNSVVHGVETPQIRKESQKPATGLINIRLVKRLNGYLELSIHDDGLGIDTEKVREKAVERGIISAEQAEQLDSKKTAALIFHPDLSTKSEADTDGGRGVGMYAIREMVKDMSGKLTINSRKGRGTTFTITIPSLSTDVEEAA